MKKNPVLALFGFVLALSTASGSDAQQPQQPAKEPAEAAKPATPEPSSGKEESSVTDHTIRIGSQTIPYKATAATIILKDDKGEATAAVFYIAYTRSDSKDSARPIAFLYNGGPGSSSVWLHMGAFGPRRVATVDAAPTPPAPYRLTDNAHCLLDAADLVFIDPVGTGFSHALGKSENKNFWGVDEDSKSIAQFVDLYVSRNSRWNSPKFLIGESYGTFRSAAVANVLQSQRGMDLNGIVMVSTVLNLGSISFNPGEDMPYIFYLPSYAATAWYHKVIADRPADLEPFLTDARRFAATEYSDALMKGSHLTNAEKSAIAKKLSRFTGLSEDYLVKADLRVSLPQFLQELQRSRGLNTGRLDARFSGPIYDLLSEYSEYDPQDKAVSGAFTAVFNDYVRDELKFGQDKTYVTLNTDANAAWNWKHQTGSFGFPGSPNVEGDLVAAMLFNSNLEVEVENGIYDLATPFFGTEYTFEHLFLPAKLQAHIHLQYYDAGHMMYVHDTDLAKLKANVAAFISRASKH